MTAFDPADVAGGADLEPLTPAQIAGLLQAARDHVVRELTALGDAWAQWRPAPGEWSATECLGHIIEADRRGFGCSLRGRSGPGCAGSVSQLA